MILRAMRRLCGWMTGHAFGPMFPWANRPILFEIRALCDLRRETRPEVLVVSFILFCVGLFVMCVKDLMLGMQVIQIALLTEMLLVQRLIRRRDALPLPGKG